MIGGGAADGGGAEVNRDLGDLALYLGPIGGAWVEGHEDVAEQSAQNRTDHIAELWRNRDDRAANADDAGQLGERRGVLLTLVLAGGEAPRVGRFGVDRVEEAGRQ